MPNPAYKFENKMPNPGCLGSSYKSLPEANFVISTFMWPLQARKRVPRMTKSGFMGIAWMKTKSIIQPTSSTKQVYNQSIMLHGGLNRVLIPHVVEEIESLVQFSFPKCEHAVRTARNTTPFGLIPEIMHGNGHMRCNSSKH